MTTTPTRAGRNLPAAITVGLALLGLVYASLAFDRVWWAVLVCTALLIAMWEWVRTIPNSDRTITTVLLGAGTIAIILSAWQEGPAGAGVAFALSSSAFALTRLSFGIDNYVRDVAAGVLGLAYIPFFASFAVILATPNDGLQRVLVLVLCVAANDTGGYLAGVFFGRHKMAPTISPKKSWEGLAGSFALTLPIITVAVTLLLDTAWWRGVLVGVIAVGSATLGDLIESAIKRDLKIKDMGTFLPGHGGMLDRIDAILLTAPIMWLTLSVIAPI